MCRKLIYGILVINMMSQFFRADECVFEDYANCIQLTDCCRVQINNDFMCVSKQQLWHNYQNRYNERYKESDKSYKNENLNFDYKEGQNTCIKWKEINSHFFTEFNIYYNCECNFTQIRWISTILLSIGLFAAF